MSLTVPKIPAWLGSVSPELYKKLVQNFDTIKLKASVLPAEETNWNTKMSLLVSSLESWKAANRKQEFLEFTGITVSFVNFCKLKGLEKTYATLLNQIKYENIFNFQGLDTLCLSWNTNYLLTYSNLVTVVDKVSGSRAAELATMTSLKNQMIDIIQVDSFQSMISSEIGKPVFFDHMHFDKAQYLNLGGLNVAKS